MRFGVRLHPSCRSRSPDLDPFGSRRSRTTEMGLMPYGVMKHPQLTVGRNRPEFRVARGPVPRESCPRQKPSGVPRSARACPSRPLFAPKTVQGPEAGEGQALALRDMTGDVEGNPFACACGIRGPKPYGPGAVNFSSNRLPSSLASCVKNRFASTYAASRMMRSFKVNVNR